MRIHNLGIFKNSLISFLLALLVMIACKEEKLKPAVVKSIKEIQHEVSGSMPLPVNLTLVKYRHFLQELDSLDIMSISTAKNKMRSIIEDSSGPLVIDSIFRVFMNFYEKMIRVNDHYFYSNKDYQKVLHEIWFANDSALDNPLPAFKKLNTKLVMSIREQYGQALIELDKYMDCGVTFDFGEGDWYLTEDPRFLMELANQFSGNIKDYLLFKATETEERIGEDAGLLIFWDELRKRIIRWEKFCAEHTELPETETELKPELLTLVHIYLFGTDNTPAYNRSTGKWKDELMYSFRKFIEENKDSKYYPLIDSIYQILKNHNYSVSNDLITFLDNNGYTDGRFKHWVLSLLLIKQNPMPLNQKLNIFLKGTINKVNKFDKHFEIHNDVIYVDENPKWGINVHVDSVNNTKTPLELGTGFIIGLNNPDSLFNRNIENIINEVYYFEILWVIENGESALKFVKVKKE